VRVASSAEGSGKTVEAAIEAARSQLGVARDRLDVEVIQEPVASTFGVIGSPARVRVTVSDAGEPVPAGTNSAATNSAATTAREGAAIRPGPARGPRPPARGPRPPVEIDPEAAVQQSEAAGDFVEGLLELLDLEADITTWADQHGGHVEVEGPDLNVLVGKEGDTLSAVEELTRLAAVRSTGDRVRVVLDINGFRARRREVLVKLARETGERVAKAGRAEELAPMPPHERKIVHDVIAEMAGIVTESVGEEPHRRVAVLPG
jgi:spoIIIJ-associated protein